MSNPKLVYQTVVSQRDICCPPVQASQALTGSGVKSSLFAPLQAKTGRGDEI